MFTDKKKDYFEKLFREYYSPLKAYAFRFVQSGIIAEDMVQDVFTRLWSASPIKEEAVKTYLFTSVRNNSLNYLKRMELEKKLMEQTDHEEIHLLYQSAITEIPDRDYVEILRLLKFYVNSLPADTRRIFLLSRKYHMKNKEIAAFLDISIKTVEKHITKALHYLREAIDKNK